MFASPITCIQSEINTDQSDEFFLCCSVKDIGCGMDAAGRTRIFSRFTQASLKIYNRSGGLKYLGSPKVQELMKCRP